MRRSKKLAPASDGRETQSFTHMSQAWLHAVRVKWQMSRK